MYESFDAIIAAPPLARQEGNAIGASREGRAVRAFVFGSGPLRVSLIGGCHADEPTGPRFLRHLASFLSRGGDAAPLLERCQWWIVPHANPDGDEINRAWYRDDDVEYDLVSYLRSVVRELPGDDVEFGFPRDASDTDARPENRAIAAWWRGGAPFHLHASLHGMAFAAGPWFLVEAKWRGRLNAFQATCSAETAVLGYELHDVERHGEKGFHRIAKGFCTRPDSRSMREHFLQLGDEETAALFRPSSMETMRALGGDPLTLVSEMPLFITPGVGVELGPPDPVAAEWKKKLEAWRAQLARERPAERIRACAASGCLRAMPVRDQMQLQWRMITAGIETLLSSAGA